MVDDSPGGIAKVPPCRAGLDPVGGHDGALAGQQSDVTPDALSLMICWRSVW